MMSRQRIPEDVLDLAHARREARADRDWARADELKAAIQEAGWTVVDRGVDFELQPARPADVVDGSRVRYGSSESIPSLLGEPSSAPASVVVVASDGPGDLDRLLSALAAHAPPGTQLVILANGPDEAQTATLDAGPAAVGGNPPEVVWTSARLSPAAALNAGLRRARGEIVVRLDARVEPTGDTITPLVRALDDETVAIAGAWGLVSPDGRRFEPAADGDAAAIVGACQAFRRADAVARGPLDERFRSIRFLDVWWSLVLRDDEAGGRPRRAVALKGLPLVLHKELDGNGAPEDIADRAGKRDFYRFLDRFGRRSDLWGAGSRASTHA
jgi:hypothetical protein